MSGTSVSTAFVTGASAIILSYYPQKAQFQVWAMLDGNASNGVVGHPGAGGHAEQAAQHVQAARH